MFSSFGGIYTDRATQKTSQADLDAWALQQQMSKYKAQANAMLGLAQNQVISENSMYPQQPPPEKTKEKTMFQEIKSDVTGMIRAHRGVIYFVAFALLVDHFVFKGVFKARLQAIVEKLVQKVEDKVAQ